ncbi:MAG: hypothetical protein R3247_02510 [Rhodothermales bacterium]|nr:hypothetical protein [Rhodothermales bacterium]
MFARSLSLLCTGLFALLLATGCAEAPTAPGLEAAPVFDGETASKGGKVTARATGSGHFNDARFPEEELRTFSFNAKQFADGSANGQWQLNNRNFPIRLHGEVECVSVSGNEAWFAGTTTNSDDPAQEGTIRGFYVVDNGEGGKAAPDQISFAFGLSSADIWCDLQPRVALNDVEKGNVQVK